MGSPRSLSAAVLGAADGLVSTSGVVAAALSAGGSHTSTARLGLAAAAAGTVSMANAEFASEGRTDWRAVCAMGLGTLFGAALPVFPLLFLAGIAGIVGTFLVAGFVVAGVSIVRCEVNKCSLRRNILTSVMGLTLGILVGLAASA